MVWLIIETHIGNGRPTGDYRLHAGNEPPAGGEWTQVVRGPFASDAEAVQEFNLCVDTDAGWIKWADRESR